MKQTYNVTITLRVTADDAWGAQLEAWDYMDTAAALIERENVFDAIVRRDPSLSYPVVTIEPPKFPALYRTADPGLPHILTEDTAP